MPSPRHHTSGAFLALVLALLPGAWSPLGAQESTTRGWNLGFHLQGVSLSIEGDETADEGSGAGVRVGYGMNRIVTFFADLDGAAIDVAEAENLEGDWRIGHLDLGARFHFANSLRWWVPFLEAAVGIRTVEVDDVGPNQDDSVTFSGGSFSVGGGMDFYFTESVAMDLGVRFTGGEFSEIEIGSVSVGDLDIDASSGRFNLGIIWWP